MRAVALLATYNEERFVQCCLNHLIQQGVRVYVIDNESTDRTTELAARYLGRGVLGIEVVPRNGVYSWRPILERKEALAMEIDADWFLHVDADEIRLPPDPKTTLAEALTSVEREGYNAVNFMEFTFVPTREDPNHDHPHFACTMQWYYPFRPSFPHRLNAWQRQDQRVDLAWSGGHKVHFPGLRMYPSSFPMKHYLFLSRDHAKRKYVERSYDPKEVSSGWHRARMGLRGEDIVLQPESELRYCGPEGHLDSSSPLSKHPLFGR